MGEGHAKVVRRELHGWLSKEVEAATRKKIAYKMWLQWKIAERREMYLKATNEARQVVRWAINEHKFQCGKDVFLTIVLRLTQRTHCF